MSANGQASDFRAHPAITVGLPPHTIVPGEGEPMNPITRANLEAALAGEALSALRYRCFADAAVDEGFVDVARVFERIATDELCAHAAQLVAALGIRGHTRENLIRAIERETAKHQRRYAEYAAQADHVGDRDEAALFERLARDEHLHADWLRESLAHLVAEPAGSAEGGAPAGQVDLVSH